MKKRSVANYHSKAYACIHVIKRDRAILLVAHDLDGDWQFLCGDSHASSEGHVVGIGHLLDSDPSLNELVDLPINSEASRSDANSPWFRKFY